MDRNQFNNEKLGKKPRSIWHICPRRGKYASVPQFPKSGFLPLCAGWIEFRDFLRLEMPGIFLPLASSRPLLSQVERELNWISGTYEFLQRMLKQSGKVGRVTYRSCFVKCEDENFWNLVPLLFPGFGRAKIEVDRKRKRCQIKMSTLDIFRPWVRETRRWNSW